MKPLTKEDIIKAADWLKKKVELENQLKEHMKFCCHWSVEQMSASLDANGNVSYDRKNICEFCQKELDYFTYSDTPLYNYPKVYSHSKNISKNK